MLAIHVGVSSSLLHKAVNHHLYLFFSGVGCMVVRVLVGSCNAYVQCCLRRTQVPQTADASPHHSPVGRTAWLMLHPPGLSRPHEQNATGRLSTLPLVHTYVLGAVCSVGLCLFFAHWGCCRGGARNRTNVQLWLRASCAPDSSRRALALTAAGRRCERQRLAARRSARGTSVSGRCVFCWPFDAAEFNTMPGSWWWAVSYS